MSEPRNNEVQRFKLAKAAWLVLLGKHSDLHSEDAAEAAVQNADAFLAALDKPKEGQ